MIKKKTSRKGSSFFFSRGRKNNSLSLFPAPSLLSLSSLFSLLSLSLSLSGSRVYLSIKSPLPRGEMT